MSSSTDSEILWIEQKWYRGWDRAAETSTTDYYYIIHFKDGSTFDTHTISNHLLPLIRKGPPDAEDSTQG